jgi:hypothetical protein
MNRHGNGLAPVHGNSGESARWGWAIVLVTGGGLVFGLGALLGAW